MTKRVTQKAKIYTPEEHWRRGKNDLVMGLQWANLINGLAVSIAKKIVLSQKKENYFERFDLVDPADKKAEYALNFGSFVERHAGGAAKSARYVVEPILLTEEMLRGHVQVSGTTGSGKTVYLKALLEQQIARGGGAFAVFGKADNKMLQQIYKVAADYGREQDLYVIDWTATRHRAKVARKRYGKKVISHSINLFEMGDEMDIVNSIMGIANIKDSDVWGDSAKNFLQAFLILLIRIDSIRLNFKPEKIDDILNADNKLEAMRRWREKANYYTLREYLNSYHSVLKFIAILQYLYEEHREIIEDQVMKEEGLENMRLDNEELGRNDYINEIKGAMQQLIKGFDPDDLLKQILKTGEVPQEIDDRKGGKQAASYDLQTAMKHYGKVLSFYDKFEFVLKSRAADVDLIEAIESGKIVIMNVPGQDQEDAPKIARFVITMLQLIVKKRGSGKPFDLTYLLILDEINSWMRSKEVLGLGNILSVIRGLGIGAIVAYQSSLEGLDENKGIEIEQITANVNTTIALRSNSPRVREMLNKLVGKVEEATEEELIDEKRNESRGRKINVKERDFFDEESLTKLAAGEGYLVRNGEASPIVTDYRGEERYLDDEEEPVDLFKSISLEELRKFA